MKPASEHLADLFIRKDGVILRFLLFVSATLVIVATAYAHDPGLSTARVVFKADRIEVALTFAPADVAALLATESSSKVVIQSATFPALAPLLREMAPTLWQVRSEGAVLSYLKSEVVLQPDNNVELRIAYAHAPPGHLVLRAPRLDDFPPGHREYVSVIDESGAVLAERLLKSKDSSVEVILSAKMDQPSRGEMPSFWGFLKLGIEHILTGYDHLLFLFGLLVVCRRWSSIIAIISCFTLAHSLTLALATLNVVHISSRIIEPCIAASIVFVGVENLIRKEMNPKRVGRSPLPSASSMALDLPPCCANLVWGKTAEAC